MFTIHGERGGVESRLGNQSFDKQEDAVNMAKYYVGTRYDVIRVKEKDAVVVWELSNAMSAPPGEAINRG